jgi:hypothetical protein
MVVGLGGLAISSYLTLFIFYQSEPLAESTIGPIAILRGVLMMPVSGMIES